MGEVTSADGAWSVNYSSAGFTAPPKVFVTAEATGTAAGDANYASVRNSTITTTGCSGRASSAVTVGLLVATVNGSANGIKISVLALGV